MRRTGNAENVERNQCAMLHLAAGLFWNESGRKKPVPDRGRVFMLAHELRRLELTNAQLDVKSLKGDISLEGMIIRSNARDATHASHGRDFRTLGFPLSSILTDLEDDCVRIFDICRGSDGYDVSVHLFPNCGDDNGLSYIDPIAHRHHMRWGELVNDIRWKDLADWEDHFSSLVHYPVKSWSEFGESSTDSGILAPSACLYCKSKVKIPAEVPLLHHHHQCGGGKHRNSMGTEGNQWRATDARAIPTHSAFSWAPSPDTPVSEGDDCNVDPPPLFAPPLQNCLPESVLPHRSANLRRWGRNDQASFNQF